MHSCYLMFMTDDHTHLSDVSVILYDKSLNAWSPSKKPVYFAPFESHWNSHGTKLTVSLGIRHQVLSILAKESLFPSTFNLCPKQWSRLCIAYWEKAAKDPEDRSRWGRPQQAAIKKISFKQCVAAIPPPPLLVTRSKLTLSRLRQLKTTTPTSEWTVTRYSWVVFQSQANSLSSPPSLPI